MTALLEAFLTRFPVPFIVGAPRSGTTLLRMMLDTHPEMAIPPETGFLPRVLRRNRLPWFSRSTLTQMIVGSEAWRDFHLDEAELARCLEKLDPFNVSDGLRGFYQLYAQRFGKSRWGDKTPNYGLIMRGIRRLLPESRCIHLIRDGRDVACSVRDLWFAPGRDYRLLGQDWARRVECIRRQNRQGAYLEVRLEDLVLNPRKVLQEVCTFIELEFDPVMLEYPAHSAERLQEHEGRSRANGRCLITKAERMDQQRRTTQALDPTRIGSWKSHMNQEAHDRFLEGGGHLLRELGYL